MKKINKHLILLLLIAALAGCGGETPEESEATNVPEPTNTATLPTPTLLPSSETIRGQAVVDSIEIELLESFPVQVNVIARGSLSDGCTQIENVIQQREEETFQVVITTIRPGDRDCTMALVPFTETIPLDVLGAEAGTYDVSVNGRSGSFTLDIDNVVAEEPTPDTGAAAAPDPTPTPTVEPAAGSLNGLVWHDVCAVAGDEAEPGPGCIADAEGNIRANGVLDDDEPGIGGVLIDLGEGSCPAVGLATATTGDDGSYAFTNLDAGDYCVSVNPLDEQNEPVLVPGEWTVLDAELGSLTVTVAEGETTGGVNLGWDYQFLPVAEVDPTSCTNSMEFVTDISIPDDTVLAPGTEFVKEWRVRNNGTCPWTTDYTLVAVDDEPLAGDSEVAVTAAVAPGQTLDVAVTLIAPDEPGTYRSNWQLANAAGERFGVNGFIEDAIYVRIVVEEGAVSATPAPNSAAIGGVVWADYCLVDGDGNPSVGCLETEEGSGFYTANGTYNIYESPVVSLTVSLSQGVCPNDGTLPTNVLLTMTTDDDGLYRFTELGGGTYCLSINAFSEENVDLLIPGDWTYPARGVGQVSLVLDEGEQVLDVDFGWDYVFD